MVWISAGAGLSFGLALGLLTAFFVTREERYDRVAEWAFVVFAVLAVPTILAVGNHLPPGIVTSVATALGVIGVVAIGLGEIGTALRLVDFRRIANFVALGFFGFLVWIGLVSLLVVSAGGLPSPLGWFGVVVIAAGLVITALVVRTPGVMTGEHEPPVGQMAAFLAPVLGIVAWLMWLGFSL